jgi:SanA protein
LLVGVVVLIALASLPTILDHLAAKRMTTNAADLPAEPVAIVLGAAVNPNGTLSDVLRARVDSALTLYRMHKVQKLLMSGDNSTAHYDEPSAMKAYAVAHGAKPEDVIRDYAGLHTFDTCYRARHVFGVTQAIFVSQKFHLPRAIFLGRELGIDSYGYEAPNNGTNVAYFQNRERLTTIEAVLELLTNHHPKYAGPPELPLIPSSDPNR